MLEGRYGIGSVYERCRPGILLMRLSPYMPHFARVENAGIIPMVADIFTTNTPIWLGVIPFSPAVGIKDIYPRKTIPGWAQTSRESIVKARQRPHL